MFMCQTQICFYVPFALSMTPVWPHHWSLPFKEDLSLDTKLIALFYYYYFFTLLLLRFLPGIPLGAAVLYLFPCHVNILYITGSICSKSKNGTPISLMKVVLKLLTLAEHIIRLIHRQATLIILYSTCVRARLHPTLVSCTSKTFQIQTLTTQTV